MKIWLIEKRMPYIEKMIEMKAGPQDEDSKCPQCRTGRAVWRCLDCCNKKPICVLCFRNIHKRDPFHRVEKWNGRYFQKGALWQVGIKIYLGHDGRPCPRSAAALSGLNEYIHSDQNQTGDILQQVAAQMGVPMTEVLQKISDALDHPDGSMTDMEREVITAASAKSGIPVLDLLDYLKTAISQGAEVDADHLRADSDTAAAAADAEAVDETGQGADGSGIPFEEDVGGDADDWEDEDERPKRGNIPRFLPRPPPTDRSGNTFLTVVHTNGFHSLPVVWCACADHSDDRDLQLLDHHLYPASYDRIKTVFTFACFHICVFG